MTPPFDLFSFVLSFDAMYDFDGPFDQAVQVSPFQVLDQSSTQSIDALLGSNFDNGFLPESFLFGIPLYDTLFEINQDNVLHGLPLTLSFTSVEKEGMVHTLKMKKGEKRFICDVCKCAFARKHDLQRHSHIHTGVKPYSCLNCTKAFRRTDALKHHLRVVESCRNSPIIHAMKASGNRRYRNL